MSRLARRWLPPLAWALLIFVLSAQSSVPSPRIPYFDKVEHTAAYAVLAALLLRALDGVAAPGWAVLLTSLYGITDEIHQAFVPGRTPDVGDWAADTLGALLALAVFSRLRRRGATSEPLEPHRSAP